MAAIEEKKSSIRDEQFEFKIAAFDISIYSSFEDVMPQWKELEAKAPSTIYQTYAWQKAWQDTIGFAEGAKPLLITASTDGQNAFILPLTLVNKSGLVTASFMGGDHANYKFALCDPRHTTAIGLILPELLDKLAALQTGSIDVFDLTRRAAVRFRWMVILMMCLLMATLSVSVRFYDLKNAV